MATSAVEYVVYRLNWQGVAGDLQRLPGRRLMAVFAAEPSADDDRHRREADVRQRVNPFRCGTNFRYLTSFPCGVFLDWLRDAEIDVPPTEHSYELVTWWDREQVNLTAFQRDRVWQGLDKVRFFDVEAVDPTRRGYAVVARQWNYNDSWYESPAAEGGQPLRVFRHWTRAEHFRRECEAAMRARVQHERMIVDLDYRDERDWPFRGQEMIVNVQDVEDVFYDLVEIDFVLNGEEQP